MKRRKKIIKLYGKDCDIVKLKGIKLSDFRKQNEIQKIVSKSFLKKEYKETKECIICNSKKIKFKTKILNIDFMQCVKCDHVFRKFYYDDKILDNYWDKEGDLINVHSHVGQSSFRSKYLSDPKVKTILKFIKKRKKAKWADLGCGNGEFLSQVKKRGIDAYGFDLNKKDIELAKKRKLKVYKSDLNNFIKICDINKIKFDVVSATGYFDMVNNPVNELKLVNRNMNKNGILMVDVPDFNSVTHELIRFFPDISIRHLSGAQRSSFTLKSLNYFLNKNGFKILFRWHYGLDIYMIMNSLIQRNQNLENSNLMKVMSKRFNDLQKIFDEEEKSDTLFFIAKKIKNF